MNPRDLLRFALAVVVVGPMLAGCDIKVDEGKVSLGLSRGRATDEWTRGYTLGKGGRFEIVNQNGEINVRGGTGPQVMVKASREATARSDEEARTLLQNVKMREDVTAERVLVEAETGDSNGFSMGRGVTVRYDVEVPRGVAVSVRTMNGAIRLADLEGQIVAGSTNGMVSGDALSGSVQASTVNGGVQMDLEAVTGDVRLTTVNGGVRLQIPKSIDADLDAATVNGGVSVDDKLGLTNVSANRSGFGPTTSITGRLNGGGPRVSLQTTNGGVRVALRGAAQQEH